MNKTVEGFVCIAVLVAVLFVGVWQIKPAHAALPFFDDFSTGDTSLWSGVENSSAFIGVKSGNGYNDTYSLLYNYTGNAGSVAYAEKGESFSAVTDLQFWLYVEDWDLGSSAYANSLGGIYYYGACRAGIGLTATKYATFCYENGTSQSITTSIQLTLGRWFLVEVQDYYHASQGNATMWIDGVLAFSQTGFDSTGMGTPTSFRCGVTADYNGLEVYYDNVKVEANYIGVPSHGPTALFTVSHNPSYANQTVSFNASTSLAGWTGTEDSPIVSWNWDFNDTHSGSGETFGHSFAQTGIYNVGLTVADGQSLNDTGYVSLTIISSFDYLTMPHGTGKLESEVRGILMKYIWNYDHNDTLICKTMNDSGFNAVYMEMNVFAWTGFVMSDFQSMIDACKAYNLSFHVLLKLQGFDGGYTNESEAEYGTGLTGCVLDWQMVYLNSSLAPESCLNRNSTRDRVKAVVQYLMANYSYITELSLDYIRYPTNYAGEECEVCYCSQCKSEFQAWLTANGKTFTTWNDYAYGGSHWKDYSEWRRTPINDMVRDVRAWAYEIRTNVTITACVFTPYYGWLPDEYLESLGQDAAYWINHGYVDAIIPMNYVDNVVSLTNRITNEQAYWLGGVTGAVPLINFISQGGGGSDVPDPVPYPDWLEIINYIRTQGSNGYILWRYGGAGFNETGTPFTDCEPYMEEIRVNSTLGCFPAFTQTVPVLAGTIDSRSVTWTTSSATTGKVEYGQYPLFPYTNNTGIYHTYMDIDYSAGTTITNSTPTTTHTIVIPLSDPFYYRILDNDSYVTLASPVYSSPFGEEGVTLTITSPTNTTYSSGFISVSLSASGGTIDTIWWNCKNGTSWIYGSNQTYTAPTSMTGFVDGASYTFYAWANNTLGEWDEETVMFTVLIIVVPYDWGSWWGDWWGIP